MSEIEHLKRNCKKAPTMEEEIEHVASNLREKIQKAMIQIPFLIITLNHLRFWLTSLQVLSMSIRRCQREKKP